MLYNAPEQCILTKCTVQRTGNKVRKCVKRCVFSTPDLRTRESIGKQRKNHPKRVVRIWQPQYDDLRTLISLHYTETQGNLDALEEFLNSTFPT